jgi:hypothetical protein
MNTAEKLNLLSQYQSAPDAIRLEKQALIDSLLTPAQRQAIEEINAEYALKAQLAADRLAALEEEIKTDILAHGATVKADHLQAVWVKGRTTWDGAKLEGMMALIPQLEQARKIGNPTVTIRKI